MHRAVFTALLLHSQAPACGSMICCFQSGQVCAAVYLEWRQQHRQSACVGDDCHMLCCPARAWGECTCETPCQHHETVSAAINTTAWNGLLGIADAATCQLAVATVMMGGDSGCSCLPALPAFLLPHMSVYVGRYERNLALYGLCLHFTSSLAGSSCHCHAACGGMSATAMPWTVHASTT
ncbi:hypothetical protein COO60DRAFT_30107 [Scenedesmus sp. NREL 46B-D3]|nr:hypothetical protein COO60DRAFT_30107 [Scenedesmus sp. NREL 46B-D3]